MNPSNNRYHSESILSFLLTSSFSQQLQAQVPHKSDIRYPSNGHTGSMSGNGVVNHAYKGEDLDLNKVKESGAQLIGITKLNNDLEHKLNSTVIDTTETVLDMTSPDKTGSDDTTVGDILKNHSSKQEKPTFPDEVVVSINNDGKQFIKNDMKNEVRNHF